MGVDKVDHKPSLDLAERNHLSRTGQLFVTPMTGLAVLELVLMAEAKALVLFNLPQTH